MNDQIETMQDTRSKTKIQKMDEKNEKAGATLLPDAAVKAVEHAKLELTNYEKVAKEIQNGINETEEQTEVMVEEVKKPVLVMQEEKKTKKTTKKPDCPLWKTSLVFCLGMLTSALIMLLVIVFFGR